MKREKNSYGVGVEKNFDTAIHYFEEAIRLRNNGLAIYQIGEMYLHGKGTATDRDTGLVMMIGAAPYSKVAQSKINRLENHLWFAKRDGDSVAHQRLKELKAAYKVFARDGNAFAQHHLDNEDFLYI